MGKKVWMLCWGLMAMMMAMAMNVSSVSAVVPQSQPKYKFSDESLTYLVGEYRLAKVYSDKKFGYVFARPNEVGSIIKIGYEDQTGVVYDENNRCSFIFAAVVQAPDNTIFAKALAIAKTGNDYGDGALYNNEILDGIKTDTVVEFGSWNEKVVIRAQIEAVHPGTDVEAETDGEDSGRVTISSSPACPAVLQESGGKLMVYLDYEYGGASCIPF